MSAAGRLSRRRFLGACAALSVVRPAEASPVPPGPDAGIVPVPGDLDVQEIATDGDPHLARSALVLSPRRRRAGDRWPVLVLLHGMGETGKEELGLHAWSDRYGLVESDSRLRHPPITRRKAARHYFTEARVAEINQALTHQPYRGFVLVCPVTPNVYVMHPTAAALDRYAAWLVGSLLPAVHERTPSLRDAASTAIDGCSLGGFVAIETFLRHPEAFGTLGALQPGLTENQAHTFAERLRDTLERVGPRCIHLATSSWDPSIKEHRLMSKRLTALGVPHEYEVLTGGHDQIFLREAGTLETLLWHDRRAHPPPRGT